MFYYRLNFISGASVRCFTYKVEYTSNNSEGKRRYNASKNTKPERTPIGGNAGLNFTLVITVHFPFIVR